jgi:hypothetical protein
MCYPRVAWDDAAGGGPHLEAVAEFFDEGAISQLDLEDLPREGMHYRDNHSC